MESQEDRFIRQFMLIEDDRKERGFDQRSVERKQRVMPQGQIDLGIYPGDNNEENPSNEIVYGHRGSTTLQENYFIDSDTGNKYFAASELIDHVDFTGITVISQEGSEFKDCIIHGALALDDYSFDFNGTSYISKNAVFENCTFYADINDMSVYYDLTGSTLIKCDLVQAEETLYNYLILAGQDSETAFNYIVNVKREDVIFNDCLLFEKP